MLRAESSMLTRSVTTTVATIKKSFKTQAHIGKPLLIGEGRYDVVPCDLFRVNNGTKVRVRTSQDQSARMRTSYDVVTYGDGVVRPTPDTGHFEGPNGISMRPNGFKLHQLISGFRGDRVRVFRLDAGLDLKPHKLLLVWEFGDHFSLQTAEPIKATALSRKLTSFFREHSVEFSPSSFFDEYPSA